ncbi:MAG: hypothetical protein ACRD72_26345, partial [Candidatus Angelobacter sp.]
DCYCALYPFAVVKKKRRRRIRLHGGSFAFSTSRAAILNSEIQSLGDHKTDFLNARDAREP